MSTHTLLKNGYKQDAKGGEAWRKTEQFECGRFETLIYFPRTSRLYKHTHQHKKGASK